MLKTIDFELPGDSVEEDAVPYKARDRKKNGRRKKKTVVVREESAAQDENDKSGE